MMDPPRDSQLGLDLPDSGRSWPDHDRFPYNFDQKTVGSRVRADLRRSTSPLLITAYTSVAVVVDFLAECREVETSAPGHFRRVRVLFGAEPGESGVSSLRARAKGVAAEIADYWLKRGISLHQCGRLLGAVEFLRRGKVEIRLSRHPFVHAKIFRGDDAIVIGSSNFSRGGLERNVEGNVRFDRGEAQEELRFREATDLAESIWMLGQDYTDGLLDLLQRLLQKVGWRDALARACAEVLEGSWAERYMQAQYFGQEIDLWPSQREGIAQAMWVLENAGSVLVADATGSGKTRMGAHLVRALQLRNWRTGRLRRDMPVLVCPPHVRRRWRREAVTCGQGLHVYSHGVLSQTKARRNEEAQRAVRRAQILAIDEAHNFLNRSSARSREVLGNMADHVLLFTATPVNRGLADLAAIVDLLGADNFEPEVLDAVGRLSKRGGGEWMPRAEEALIRDALQRFIVRRTKPMLNRLIDREPDRYRNVLGQRCRYPEHRARTYSGGEGEEDRRLAEEIRDRASHLRGLVMLRRDLRLPEHLKWEGWTDEIFLKWRLGGARGIAIYQVMSRLRSSRAALYEHLQGTGSAQKRFHIPGPGKASHSGDLISTLEQIAGMPPIVELDTDVPSWLEDPEAHATACSEEVEVYRDIADLVAQISADREERKADLLAELSAEHPLLLAYDGHLISLFDLRERLRSRGFDNVILATGSRRQEQERLTRAFALGADRNPTIGLCSDALSETVNLQGASVLVHLDMPTVMRIVEQRVGRVDRMDSPHHAIEVYWPKDSPEFALHADEKLFSRHQDVAELLGSNVPLPEDLKSDPQQDRVVETEELIREFEKSERLDLPPDQLRDAFDPVRRLVDGSEALVPAALYETLRHSDVRVLASVSVVRSQERDWAFMAVAGTEWRAPRWVYVSDELEEPETDLERVATAVRRQLQGEPEDVPFDHGAAGILKECIERVRVTEEQLLPGRKRRALEELRWLTERYLRDVDTRGDPERLEVLGFLQTLANPEGTQFSVDRSKLADWWLDCIRPTWYEFLRRRHKRRPAVLREIRRTLLDNPLSTEALESIWEVDLEILPLDQRIVAAIVGVS